jgi:hypothetical protein
VSLAAPVALLALVALPVLWWLHRRARRPAEVVVPSLLFHEESETAAARDRRRFDPELLLTLAAATLLVLAAAGPIVEAGKAGRTVRVVVLSGAAATARGQEERTDAALRRLHEALGPTDRIEVVREPADPEGPRPTEGRLLDAARAGAADLRFVVSDRAARGPTGEVGWITAGDPGARNRGIVAATMEERPGGLAVFANLRNDTEADEDLRLVLTTESRDAFAEARARVAAGGLATATIPLDSVPEELVLSLEGEDGLAADDRVSFVRRPLAVEFDPSVPGAHARAVRLGLEAVLGSGGFVEGRVPDLVVTARPSPPRGVTLVLDPVPAGAEAIEALEGPETVRTDPLVRDLSAGGVGLAYRPGAERPTEGYDPLLSRRAGRGFVVVERRGDLVRFAPDPLRGRPAPVATPLWPLFLENLVGEVAGDLGPLGYRRRGLLDDATSRLGRTPPAPSIEIPASPAEVPAPARSVDLRPWLVLSGLLCLLLLWAHPASRGTRAGRPRAPSSPIS